MIIQIFSMNMIREFPSLNIFPDRIKGQLEKYFIDSMLKGAGVVEDESAGYWIREMG